MSVTLMPELSARAPEADVPSGGPCGESPEAAEQLRAALRSLERSRVAIQTATALMAVGALWLGQPVLAPIVLSILLAYAIEPAVQRLETWHLRRSLGVPVLLVTLGGALAGTAYLLRGQAIAFTEELPVAAHRIAGLLHDWPSPATGALERMQKAATELENAAAAVRVAVPTTGVQSVRVQEPTFNWGAWVWTGSYSAAGLTVQLATVVFLVYYLLVSGDLYKRKLVHLAGPSMSAKKATVQILADISAQIARFLWARAAISAAVGLLIGTGFRLIGLSDPAAWAVVSALLVAVPFAGPAVVVLGASLAAFVQFDSATMAWVTAGTSLTVFVIESNVLTPILIGRVGDMNAVSVFVSLLFWGWIWGVWGLLLAVPIMAALKAVCERIDSLNTVAELLGT